MATPKPTGIECLELLVASKRSWSVIERQAYTRLRRLLTHGRAPKKKAG